MDFDVPWMIPGMYPRIVNKMLINYIESQIRRLCDLSRMLTKSALQPRSRNTPRGGKKMAKLVGKVSIVIPLSGAVELTESNATLLSVNIYCL